MSAGSIHSSKRRTQRCWSQRLPWRQCWDASQSEPVPCRNPDVGPALFLDDQLDLVIDLIEAVALNDGWKQAERTVSIRLSLIGQFRNTGVVLTCETLQEVLFQFDGSIQSFSRLILGQTLV